MRKKLWALGACLLIGATAAPAQTTTGAIVGTVMDPTGALVPSAAVTVTNMGTGSTFKATTDPSGNYVVTPLQVGRYSVAVVAAGFKRDVKSGIRVDVQSRVRMDFSLQVGNVTESVEVVSETP